MALNCALMKSSLGGGELGRRAEVERGADQKHAPARILQRRHGLSRRSLLAKGDRLRADAGGGRCGGDGNEEIAAGQVAHHGITSGKT